MWLPQVCLISVPSFHIVNFHKCFFQDLTQVRMSGRLAEGFSGREFSPRTYPDGTRPHRRSSSWAWPDSQTCGASDPEKRPRTQKSGSALFRPPGLGVALKQVVLRPASTVAVALETDNLGNVLEITTSSRTICWYSRLFSSYIKY